MQSWVRPPMHDAAHMVGAASSPSITRLVPNGGTGIHGRASTWAQGGAAVGVWMKTAPGTLNTQLGTMPRRPLRVATICAEWRGGTAVTQAVQLEMPDGEEHWPP
jgi:hypothetical protein